MEGDVADLPLTELIQLLCMGGHNRDIQVFDGPTWLGVVSVREGQLDQCFAYGSWGRPALFKLFAVRRGPLSRLGCRVASQRRATDLA